MRLIAHRGNLWGSNPEFENKPSYIQKAIKRGFEVEIDVWYDKGWWLGHDKPQYKTTYKWMFNRQDLLWVHCKNLEAMTELTSKVAYLNFFWHQNDDFTLTSQGYVWTYPGRTLSTTSISVSPEKTGYCPDTLSKCAGICSDYIASYVKLQSD